MKTVQSSYLHLSNILLSWIELSSWIVELSFSTRLKFLSSTSQFNLTLFQKKFNLTQHFSSRVLNLNSSTQLDAISLLIFDQQYDCLSKFNIWFMSEWSLIERSYASFINQVISDWETYSLSSFQSTSSSTWQLSKLIS